MPKFLFDSDIIIWCLRGREDTVMAIREVQKTWTAQCSAISLTEVLLGVKKGEEEITKNFLDTLEAYPIDREVACLAGDLIKNNKKSGVILEIPDAIIAATCIINDFILVTCNKKHYQALGIKMQIL